MVGCRNTRKESTNWHSPPGVRVDFEAEKWHYTNYVDRRIVMFFQLSRDSDFLFPQPKIRAIIHPPFYGKYPDCT